MAVLLAVGVAVSVAVCVSVALPVTVAVTESDAVTVAEGVGVWVSDADPVMLYVAVAVTVTLAVVVTLTEGLTLLVSVAVGVAVPLPVTVTLSLALALPLPLTLTLALTLPVHVAVGVGLGVTEGEGEVCTNTSSANTRLPVTAQDTFCQPDCDVENHSACVYVTERPLGMAKAPSAVTVAQVTSGTAVMPTELPKASVAPAARVKLTSAACTTPPTTLSDAPLASATPSVMLLVLLLAGAGSTVTVTFPLAARSWAQEKAADRTATPATVPLTLTLTNEAGVSVSPVAATSRPAGHDVICVKADVHTAPFPYASLTPHDTCTGTPAVSITLLSLSHTTAALPASGHTVTLVMLPGKASRPYMTQHVYAPDVMRGARAVTTPLPITVTVPNTDTAGSPDTPRRVHANRMSPPVTAVAAWSTVRLLPQESRSNTAATHSSPAPMVALSIVATLADALTAPGETERRRGPPVNTPPGALTLTVYVPDTSGVPVSVRLVLPAPTLPVVSTNVLLPFTAVALRANTPAAPTSLPCASASASVMITGAPAAALIALIGDVYVTAPPPYTTVTAAAVMLATAPGVTTNTPL